MNANTLHHRFRVLDLVNAGGQGKLFVCKEVKSRELKAVKVYEYLPSSQAFPYFGDERDPRRENLPEKLKELVTWMEPQQRLSRFLKQQVLNLATLDHPGILQPIELILNEPVCMIFPLIRGGSLASRTRKKQGLTFHEAGVYLAQLVQILDHLHRRNVIHRDIKPQNILIGPRDQVILSDFDFAHFPLPGIRKLLLMGRYRYKGTAMYMAPEHLKGAYPHPGMDQYSLATTLYEILTLKFPFGNHLLAREDLNEYRPVSFLTKSQNNAMKKALHPEPKQRFSQIVEFYQELYSL